ncbi:kinase-like domain-containing protein [Aspergillus pseudodeflectus]|uniref:Altered inheritance of mitochondria protein 9, mitochondrial n=1 Tax=Aspergillus pseudodeflectus TaxID=176178 RepID=A0ABR4KUK6_9EURO
MGPTLPCPIPGTFWRQSIRMAFLCQYFPVLRNAFCVPSRNISANPNRRLMNSASDFGIDPYAYTSGRFLRRDKLEVAARYIQFNYPALCRKVLEVSPGASAIVDCAKIDGGFNRVFIFSLDNGEKLVARIPFRFSGPAKLSTLSEVSTIRYLQHKTSIPIPKVLDWSHDAGDADNPVGSEYIIMEHASGVPLIEKWNTLAGDQKVNCIASINKAMKEVSDLQYPAYGSIYFDDLLDSTDKEPLDTGFCIGPHCSTRYWDTNIGESRYYHNVKPNHGPWKSIGEFSDGLIDAALSRVPHTDSMPDTRPTYHGSPEAHLALLEMARSVLKQMALDTQIQNYAKPLLFHSDLHKRNIFVSEDDPTVITGIIDWQGTSVEPAFWYSDELPDFATEHELLKQAFDVTSQYYTPQLAGPRLVDESLFRPFLYSYRTWRDGAVALRHELIKTARLWDDLGLDGPCPYPQPGQEEFAKHMKQYKLFEAAQQLRVDLYSLVNTGSGGWVPTDQWEAAQVCNKDLFREALEAVVTSPDVHDDEPVREEKTLRSIWPFDLPQ